MRIGKLNKIFKVYPIVETTTLGDVAITFGTAVTLRGDIKQLSGSRKMVYTQDVSTEVYSIKCYDNSALKVGTKIEYNSIDIFIKSIDRNYDNSATDIVNIIAHKQ